MCVEYLLPGGPGERSEVGGGNVGAGFVEQQVEPVEGALDAREHAVHGIGIADVAGQRQHGRPAGRSRLRQRLLAAAADGHPIARRRSEEHTSELQSLMRISYAVFCLKKKNNSNVTHVPYKHKLTT